MNIVRSICVKTRAKTINKNLYRKFRNTSVLSDPPQSQTELVEETFDENFNLKIPERSFRRKPKIEPFMKDVFLAKFNREMLAYPEILNKEETGEMLDRVSRLEKTFLNPESTENERINTLKQNKMYTAPISLTDNGLSMLTTERIRYLEAISSDRKLATELIEHWVCLDTVRQGLKKEDYDKIIQEIISKDHLISLCTKELMATRVNESDFRTKARLEGNNIWLINGQKECNSIQDYQLVLCSLDANRLKMFLVLPDAKGVNFTKPLLNFVNTPAIPLDQVTGNKLASCMGLNRLDTAVICQTILKEAMEVSVKYIRGKFVSGKPLAELPAISQRVGNALLHLYACESAVYFTAGLLDGYEEPDADIEMAMCRNFICHHAVECITKLYNIAGVESKEVLKRHLEDVLDLANGLEAQSNVDMFIALNGIHRAGKIISEEVKKIRNPIMNPAFIIRKMWSDRRQENDDPKLTLQLCQHLHPSLKQVSDEIEYGVFRLKYACETLMGMHGFEIAMKHTELERLAQVATEIYMMTAAVARASRSYCIGLPNAEVEMKLAAGFVEKTTPRVRKLIKEIEDGEYLNQDHVRISLGQKVLDTQSGLVEKPYVRVWW